MKKTSSVLLAVLVGMMFAVGAFAVKPADAPETITIDGAAKKQAEREALEQSEPGTVEQGACEPRHAMQVPQEPGCHPSVKDRRQPNWPTGAYPMRFENLRVGDPAWLWMEVSREAPKPAKRR